MRTICLNTDIFIVFLTLLLEQHSFGGLSITYYLNLTNNLLTCMIISLCSSFSLTHDLTSLNNIETWWASFAWSFLNTAFNVGIILKVSNRRSLMLIDRQQYANQASQIRFDSWDEFVLWNRSWDGVSQGCSGLAVNKRGNSMKKLIDEDTKGPDICFFTICIHDDSFRRHE